MASPKPTSSTPAVITISQQALNIARQILSAQGWAVTIDDIYIGGKLLSEILPELDDLSWIKDPAEVAAMKPPLRAAYQKRDLEWGAKQVPISLTDKQKEVFKRAFTKMVEGGKLAPHAAMSELIVAFGLVKEE